MKLKKLIFKVLLIVFFVALVLLCAIMYLMWSSLVSTSYPDLSEISQITELNFSENTKLLGSKYAISLDSILVFALQMPGDEIEDLFPEEKFHPSTTVRYLENYNDRDHEWFKPDSIKAFKSFDYTNTNNTGMYVLYDNSDKPVIEVYILWFSM